MPDVRQRAALELRRFTAAPVSADLVLVELDGSLAVPTSRFGRRPVLVVELGEGSRTELAPVRSEGYGRDWHAAYAVPVDALGGRFALGVRGTLLDLPDPDVVEGGDRAAAIAREANRLRRRIEELEIAEAEAQARADAAHAALGGAVAMARDEERTHAAAQAAAVESERGAEREAAAGRTAELQAAVESERDAAARHAEELLADHEAQLQTAAAETEAALQAEREIAGQMLLRAEAAEARAQANYAGLEVLRAELAEERAAPAAPFTPPPAPAGPEPDVDPQATQPLPLAAEEAEPTVVAAAPTPTRRRPIDLLAARHVATAGPGAAITDVVRPPSRGPAPSHWFAVAALVVFAFLVLGLLFGFLG